MTVKNNYLNRGYLVTSTTQAKKIAKLHLEKLDLADKFSFGLPEVDDRYHVWRVPLVATGHRIGEIVINSKTSTIDYKKSSKSPFLIKKAMEVVHTQKKVKKEKKIISKSPLNNMLLQGNCAETLKKLPDESVNLVFTSPPYYNAKPEYSEYHTYDEYLSLLRSVIKECHRVLSEGRFFVINVSPVLIRRASRNEASKRIAVPFDLHRLFIEEGYEFIDDIHWVKPEGAGWALGRGRRFAADRNPLQYKPVPVTEYILVYRKKTDKLIDWNIRNHHSKEDVFDSKIGDDYEKTNLWKINPSRNRKHPATFPYGLAERVIKYYSFKNDVILDPFAGSGTTAKAAIDLGRRFVMCEISEQYIDLIIEGTMLGGDLKIIN
ncbi:DNA-methyltransferase [Escherichia coli]|uniref:DNA-methyltransferase n=1 Tax=Escherichia coli TaxID=562 RepID=UPI003966E398